MTGGPLYAMPEAARRREAERFVGRRVVVEVNRARAASARREYLQGTAVAVAWPNTGRVHLLVLVDVVGLDAGDHLPRFSAQALSLATIESIAVAPAPGTF